MSDWKPREPITSRKLNAHSAIKGQTEVSGPPGSSSKFGAHFATTNPDLTNTGMWIRVTSDPVTVSTTAGPSKEQSVRLHSWEAIYWNDGRKMWQPNPGDYGNVSNVCATIYDYDAVIAPDFSNLTKTLDANITACNTNQTGVTPYFAVRDPVSRRLIAVNTAPQQGTFNATSTETVLMILGTYDEYKNCPGVANVVAEPPKAITDFCSGARSTDLCVPAYAYAVYQRCGYVWNKIGDTRTYRVWANEMNGAGTSAWRRFVIPRWGGNLTANGPNPDDNCMGVAFMGSGAGALTCTCPSWASNVTNCIRVNFKTTPRPCAYDAGNVSCGYTDCADIFTLFDAGDAEGPYWDREFSVDITGSMCSNGIQFGGGAGAGNVGIEFVDTERTECYWGPDVFDPCNPCDGFGKFRLRIELNTEERPNCGGVGHVYADMSQEEMLAVLCDCTEVTPSTIEVCDGCDGGGTQAPLVVIDTTSIKITCCDDILDGGSATNVPANTVDGQGATNIYDGGNA